MQLAKIRSEINAQRISAIINEAATHYGITAHDLTMPGRLNHEARHITIVACFFASQASMAEIGRQFNRTHPAVINALKAYDDRLKHATNHRIILGALLIIFDAREAMRKLKL